MTLVTIVLRNGTQVKFDADSASVGPNAANPAGFNFLFRGPRVPQILHLRSEQVDAVLYGGEVIIGDQLLSPQPAMPAPAATTPATTTVKP